MASGSDPATYANADMGLEDDRERQPLQLKLTNEPMDDNDDEPKGTTQWQGQADVRHDARHAEILELKTPLKAGLCQAGRTLQPKRES